MKLYSILITVCFLVSGSYAQKGQIIRFTTSHAMFPDTLRKDGYDYNGRHFDAATHYSDSSVLLFIPSSFRPSEKINLVFWFHGWGNNIDTAVRQYELTDQFEASGRNAVFVFPEGPKNASDSYGGKLEQPAVFQALLNEVAMKIQPAKKFSPGQYTISLAGHSGAYRVISRIINQTPVDEVILFDAMYGGNEFYLKWLSDPAHRFINIYTKDGGTYNNSLDIYKQVTDSMHISAVSVKEEEVTQDLLRRAKKLFIFSGKGHNEVITNNRNWERFLASVD